MLLRFYVDHTFILLYVYALMRLSYHYFSILCLFVSFSAFVHVCVSAFGPYNFTRFAFMRLCLDAGMPLCVYACMR